ncbi:MAG TPA: TetR/AcrR family transcriptional regulator [Kiloniellales bacterium]|nr:TetR/AcrR family transcriptional regulator [Kiloniellales bacterium]
MVWSKDRERGYHHGNLRAALMRAALALIQQKGPHGFSFAEAARAAGVSAAAPYRHFRGLDELLADVAREGFEKLEQALTAAWQDGRPHPFAAFERVGKAYLEFARKEPAYYAAMFEAGLPPDLDADLRQAADRAFAVLRAAAEALSQRLAKDRRPPAMMMSLHIWALTHGIASLFGRGDRGRRKLPMTAEELLEAAILIYLQGLGINWPAET